MAEDQGSKTEKATPRRRKEARAEGQIPRSVDVVQWGVLVAATFFAPPLLGRVLTSLQVRSRAAITLSAQRELEPVLGLLWGLVVDLAIVLIPMMMLVMVMTVAGLAVQGGVMLSGRSLKPKWQRLSPMAGVKRLASPDSVVDTAKSLLRLTMLAVIVILVVPSVARDHLSGGAIGASEGAVLAAADVVLLLRLLAIAGLLVGLADIGFQRWRTERRLRMTKHEVKQEMRSSEGNPEVRARRRQLHQRMTRNQMLSAVQNSSVVVVNPIHVAVALKYGDGLAAPRVVAKGIDDVAERIRLRAIEAEVPIVESRALAWLLHDTTAVGRDVPVELYHAVALVLAFVLRSRPSALTGIIRRVNVPSSALEPARALTTSAGRR
ncbi:MAG: EscU/YscU/HrcU family type III secretion system export apparatus switch protein [Acidimicrobiia bacterium]|nr:EscU/YscU/HrcU family type III secretion system export apparatus switch protein [Acidimicrobiia bacterium]MDH5520060.1 EscU/YscU/HrcU family type III secretion system export apparatus switch protein [Acidimicrobiia bacterium]